jgi:hypothetical protein
MHSKLKILPSLFIILLFLSKVLTAQNNSIFFGGINSGISVFCYEQAHPIFNDIYKGGSNSGFETFCKTQTEGQFNNNIFLGGQVNQIPVYCFGQIDPTTLPITLIFFSAEPINNNYVLLTWETANEVNNDYFIIEKSKDAFNWIFVDKVYGSGNSAQTLRYQLNDYMPIQDISYYRLLQVDFDGTITSKAIDVVEIKQVSFFKIYPNPSSGIFNIQTNLSDFNLVVYDTKMKLVASLAGNQQINLQNLPTGIYYLKAFNKKEVITKIIFKT